MSLRINRYTAEELKAMLPFIAVTNGGALLISVVLGSVFGFDWTVYSGLLIGNALMLANFILIGITADKIVKCRDFRRGRSIGSISYGLRYAGMFAVLAGLLTIRAVNIVTAVLPLCYPKIYYTFIYTLTRGKDDE